MRFICFQSCVGPDYFVNYLTVGDIVTIQFNSTYNIRQSQIVKMKLVPEKVRSDRVRDPGRYLHDASHYVSLESLI